MSHELASTTTQNLRSGRWECGPHQTTGVTRKLQKYRIVRNETFVAIPETSLGGGGSDIHPATHVSFSKKAAFLSGPWNLFWVPPSFQSFFETCLSLSLYSTCRGRTFWYLFLLLFFNLRTSLANQLSSLPVPSLGQNRNLAICSFLNNWGGL